MTHLCYACGECDSFKANQDCTNYTTEEVFMDGEGSITDYGDSDTYDSDSGEIDNYECMSCGSGDVHWLEDEELEEKKQEIADREEAKEHRKNNNWKKVIEGE